MSLKRLVQSLTVVGSLAISAAFAYGQNAQTRDGFWISGGLGYGSLGCDNCGGSREGGISGGLSLGGTITPRFLLGVGSDAWAKSQQGATLTVGTLDARVRFYPSTTGGFFLTGGLGVGTVSAGGSGYIASETGLGMLFGAGYDVRVGRNTSLTPYWSGFAMRNANTDANVGQVGLAITLH